MARPYVKRSTEISSRVKVRVGRRPVLHVPTDYQRYQVQQMAAFGIPYEEIAAVIGISHDTLSLRYADELRRGRPEANYRVARKLYSTATRGRGREAVTAQMFWLSTRGGSAWKKTETHQLVGADNGPIRTEEVGQLTDKERAIRLLQILNAGATESD